MKARVKFNKYGVLRFIGHLDVMRYFQKAMRRAGIDIGYSQGYNPHQLMSFASPLGVGITSDGEYLDIVLNSDIDKDEFIDKLNAQMVEGIEILDFIKLDDEAKNSMSKVSAADYAIGIKDEYLDQMLNKSQSIRFKIITYGDDTYILNKKFNSLSCGFVQDITHNKISNLSMSLSNKKFNSNYITFTPTTQETNFQANLNLVAYLEEV